MDGDLETALIGRPWRRVFQKCQPRRTVSTGSAPPISTAGSQIDDQSAGGASLGAVER